MENETSITVARVPALPRHAFTLGTASAVLALTGYAHYRATAYGDDYTGLLAPLDRLFDLGLALGLMVIAFAVGRALCRRLSLDFRGLAEEVSFSVLLGTGTIGLSVFGLGILGLLSPAPTTVLLILFVAASRRELSGAYGRACARLRSFRGALSGKRVAGIFFTVICLLLLHYLTTAALYNYSLLQTALIAGVTLVLACLLGRRLPIPHRSLDEEPSRGIMGCVVVCVCVFGLNQVGLLSPLSIAVLELLLLALFRREVVQLFDSISKDFLRYVELPGARHLCAMLFASVCVVLLLGASMPPHDYDEGIYHLAATKLFVERGQIYPLYDNALGNMPFLVHMTYALCLMAKADIAARFLSLILALVTALAVYAFCARFLTRRTGWLAIFGLFGANMVMKVGVTARIDVTLTGMLFATAYAMMVYLETRRRGWLYASAVLAGFSLGIKMTAVMWLLPVGVMFLYESLLRNRAPLLEVLKSGAMFALIMVAIASPWYVKNYAWFGNPIYPFGTGELAQYEEGRFRYFTLEDDRKLESYFDAARKEIPERVGKFEEQFAKAVARRPERTPWRIWDYFLRPDLYEVGEQNTTPNYLFLALPLLLIAARRRWVWWMVAASVFFFLFITKSNWIARYWLPVIPALTIAAVYALDSVAASLKRRWRLAYALPVAAVFLIVTPVMYASLTESLGANNLSFITGETSRRAFLNQRFYYPAVDFVNRQLPADARVMMIGVQMNYDLRRPFIADTSWDCMDWQRALLRNDSLEEVRDDLKRRGVTHFVYSPTLYYFAAETGMEVGPTVGTPARRQGAYTLAGFSGGERVEGPAYAAEPDYKVQLRVLATFELFRSKFLEPVYKDRFGYEIYRLR